MINKNRRLLQLLAIVCVMCFLVIMVTSKRKLLRRSKLCSYLKKNSLVATKTLNFLIVDDARYPWAENDLVYSISEEEKSDILDRISSEVRKAVAQAAEDTKIQLENKAALAKNASKSLKLYTVTILIWHVRLCQCLVEEI